MAKATDQEQITAKQAAEYSVFICERKDDRPLYIIATTVEIATKGAKWFLGGSPVVGLAKGMPQIGFQVVCQVPDRQIKPGHSGFVTRTFAK